MRLSHGWRGRRVRPAAVCVGSKAAGGDAAAVDFAFAFSLLPFGSAGLPQRRAAPLRIGLRPLGLGLLFTRKGLVGYHCLAGN